MLARPCVRHKFFWTPELDGILGRAYLYARSRAELSANLTNLERRCGFTRNVILGRAIQLGLSFSNRRPWTDEEVEVLQTYAGRQTPKALATKLNRTHSSVKAKLKELSLSARIREGYTQDDLRQLLGVSNRSIKDWLAWGWLRMVQNRIPEASVSRFLRLHSEQYHLGRVDQAWFKGLVFPAFNSAERKDEAPRRVLHRVEASRAEMQKPYVISESGPDADVA
jgi:DNA-binding CsgD family transcriptional regulator